MTINLIDLNLVALFTSQSIFIDVVTIGGSRGRLGRVPPPSRSNFFHFHAIFGKNFTK